jgi:hypothetical protein
MNMMTRRKQNPAPEPDIEALTLRRVELCALSKPLLDQQIKLEAKRSSDNQGREPASGTVQDLTIRFLSGARPQLSEPARLADVIQMRAALEKAIEHTDGQLALAWNAHAQDNYRLIGAGYRELAREEIMLLCRLDHLQRLKRDKAKEIRGKAAGFPLPCEPSFNPFNDFRTKAAVVEMMRSILRAGICTKSELAKQRGLNEKVIKDESAI